LYNCLLLRKSLENSIMSKFTALPIITLIIKLVRVTKSITWAFCGNIAKTFNRFFAQFGAQFENLIADDGTDTDSAPHAIVPKWTRTNVWYVVHWLISGEICSVSEPTIPSLFIRPSYVADASMYESLAYMWAASNRFFFEGIP